MVVHRAGPEWVGRHRTGWTAVLGPAIRREILVPAAQVTWTTQALHDPRRPITCFLPRTPRGRRPFPPRWQHLLVSWAADSVAQEAMEEVLGQADFGARAVQVVGRAAGDDPQVGRRRSVDGLRQGSTVSDPARTLR